MKRSMNFAWYSALNHAMTYHTNQSDTLTHQTGTCRILIYQIISCNYVLRESIVGRLVV